MPLSFPTKRPSKPIAQKLREALTQTLYYIRPEILVLGIVVLSAIFVFLKISNLGWYAFASILTIGYFAERMAVVFKRKAILTQGQIPPYNKNKEKEGQKE